jgi:enterochelin esterase-like enzyme
MLSIRYAWAFIAFFTWQPAHASEIRSDFVPSKALARPMPVTIYLPDGYESGQKRYPVLYLLHGAGGDERAWLTRGHIQETADRLMRSGAIPSAILVMPGCPKCWWVDGAKDKAETAFWSDLVPAIDIRYRTIATRSGRLVAGLSAGGYGAIRFALRYPDRLAAAAALSPAIYTENVPATSAARSQPPFLGPDGQFSQSAWDEHNYPQYLATYFGQAYRVPLYLASGDADRLGIAYETSLLFKRVFERQPEQVELRVVDGDHSWKVWESMIGDAMKYMFRYAQEPIVTVRTANVSDKSQKLDTTK